MGKRGPKTQPTAVLQMKGTHRKHRHGDPADEPEFEPADYTQSPPDWLGEYGKAVWVEIAPQLSAVNCLTNADLAAFACYCSAWDDFHAARADIEKFGRVAISDKGSHYQHPAVGVKNKATSIIKDFSREFGLTPSARTGLNVKPKEDNKQDGKKRFFA